MYKFKKQLLRYNPASKDEVSFKIEMLDYMKKKGSQAFLRETKRAHFTASAWLIDKETKQILLLKHAKLNKWLQPGGHADGESDLEKVAIKEALEETNIQHLTLASDGIFDIDIHGIPATGTVQEHLHYDVRYAFFVEDRIATKINEESTAFKWLSLQEIEKQSTNHSILRMVEKTKDLF